jgi:hypothetical protein
MKKLLPLLILCLSTAHAECLPKEAEGTGSTIRKASEPKTYNAVIAWTCPDGTVVWRGIRDSAQHLAVPRTPEAVRAHLVKLDVWHAHDRLGMSDIAHLVPLAK